MELVWGLYDQLRMYNNWWLGPVLVLYGIASFLWLLFAPLLLLISVVQFFVSAPTPLQLGLINLVIFLGALGSIPLGRWLGRDYRRALPPARRGLSGWLKKPKPSRNSANVQTRQRRCDCGPFDLFEFCAVFQINAAC